MSNDISSHLIHEYHLDDVHYPIEDITFIYRFYPYEECGRPRKSGK